MLHKKDISFFLQGKRFSYSCFCIFGKTFLHIIGIKLPLHIRNATVLETRLQSWRPGYVIILMKYF